jgi:hypothetical protein
MPHQIAQETTQSSTSEPNIAESNQETLLQIAQETTHSKTLNHELQIDSSIKILEKWGEHNYSTTVLSLIPLIYFSKTRRMQPIGVGMQNIRLNIHSISFSALLDIPCHIYNIAMCFFRRIHFTRFVAL